MKIRIDLKLLFFLVLFYFTRQIKIYLLILGFAFLHELAHMLVGLILGFKLLQIEIIPLGFCIKFLPKKESTESAWVRLEKEAEKSDIVSGPFQRLEEFFTKKEKRQLPNFDKDGQNTARYNMWFTNLKNRLTNPFKSGYGKLSQAFGELRTSRNKLDGLTKAQKFDTMWDGVKNAFGALRNSPAPQMLSGVEGQTRTTVEALKALGVDMGEIGVEAGAIGGELALANGELVAVGAGTSAMSGEMAIINGTTATLATESGVATGQLAVINGELFVLDEEMGAVAVSSGALATESSVAGAEMGAASGGVTFMGLAEMGLAGAFTTLIVPTLAIAGVIAILIPIIAGLAIEALYFINLVGQFMTALDWDSINVDSAVKSLQSLATALAWLGVAMASLGFDSFMSNITMLQVGLQNILFGGMDATLQLLREVSVKINAMGDVSVDESTVQGIQSLGSALNAISSAMLSLTGVTLTSFIGNILTLNGRLGNLSSNLDKAKGDLQHAITVINSMDFSQIDEAKVGTIKTTLEAIGAFADAFKGLNDIRSADDWGNFTTWLLNLGGQGQSIQDAFNKAHDDIVMATKALQGYNDIGEVPEEIGTKLQNVSTAITSIADIIKALKDLKEDKGFLGALDSFANGSNDDLVTGLTNSMGTIRTIAQRVNSLKTISNIDPLVAEKLKQLSTAISNISSVLDSFNNIKASSDSGVIDSMPKIIQKAHHNIRLVATNLNGLKTISNIDPLVAQKVKSVASNLKAVNSAMNQMSTLNATVGALNFNGLNQKIVGVAYTISSTAFQLNKLGTNLADSNHNVDGSLTGKINNVTKGTSAMSKFATTMTAFPYVDGHNIGDKVARAVTGFKRASAHLKKINDNDKVANITTIINQVKTAVSSLKKAIKGMNFGSAGRNIGASMSRGVTGGLANLAPRVTGAVGRATNAGASRAWTGGAYMGQSATGGFKSALKLVDAINTEINNVISTINARAPEISGAMSNATDTDGSGSTGATTTGTGNAGDTGGSGDWFAGLFSGPGGSVRATSDYGQAVNPVRNNGLSPTEMASLNNMNRTGNLNNTNNPVNIIVGEGAVQLDARDLTVKESRQVMINALQGLGMIKNIELNPTQ